MFSENITCFSHSASFFLHYKTEGRIMKPKRVVKNSYANFLHTWSLPNPRQLFCAYSILDFQAKTNPLAPSLPTFDRMAFLTHWKNCFGIAYCPPQHHDGIILPGVGATHSAQFITNNSISSLVLWLWARLPGTKVKGSIREGKRKA